VSQTESTPHHDDDGAGGDSVDDRSMPAPSQDALKPKRAARRRGHGKTTSEDGRVLTALHIGGFASRVVVCLVQV
jgi:hypothetical protein